LITNIISRSVISII